MAEANLKVKVDPSRGLSGLKSFRNSLRRTKGSATSLTSGISGMVMKIGTLTTGLVGLTSALGGLTFGFIGAKQHWTAMAEVSTLIKGTSAEIAFLNKASNDLLQTYGGSSANILQGFYQAISAGMGDVADSAEFMETALKLSVGGVTDTITSVTALTSVVNAYKHENYEAARAADVLFTTVRLGKTTISELGNQIGRITSLASPLGIQFEEVAAALAVITGKGGFSTDTAATAFRGALTAMVSPAQQTIKLLEKLEKQTGVVGLEFTASNLAANGFLGMLEKLAQATGGDKDLITKIFPNVEALASDVSVNHQFTQ